MSALDEIAAERRRQIEAEGWTTKHDDTHRDGSLARVAACYASLAGAYPTVSWDVALDGYSKAEPSHSWPSSWSRKWWKPKSPRSDLVRAGALIVAEIERLDRAAARSPQETAHD